MMGQWFRMFWKEGEPAPERAEEVSDPPPVAKAPVEGAREAERLALELEVLEQRFDRWRADRDAATT